MEKFKSKFKEKYPNCEIIDFINMQSPIRFKDENGTIYCKNNPHRVLTHSLNIEAVEDKLSFIQNKLSTLFPNLKIIEYISSKKGIIIEDENGFRYKTYYNDLLRGHPVSIQTCLNKFELFKFKANIKHNSKYNYINFDYENGKQKINISCPIHGDFKQTIESHLYGNGCPKCKGGFTKEKYTNKYDNMILYLVRLYNDKEEFLKIGITSKSAKERYNRKDVESYNMDIVFEIKMATSVVYDKEKEILDEFKQFKYQPIDNIAGHSECLTTECFTKLIEKYENIPYQ